MKMRNWLLAVLTAVVMLGGASAPALAIIVTDPLSGGVTFALADNPFGFEENLFNVGGGTPAVFNNFSLVGGFATYDDATTNFDELVDSTTIDSNRFDLVNDATFDFQFDFGNLTLFPENDLDFDNGFPLMLFGNGDGVLTGFDYFVFDFELNNRFFDITVSGIDWFIEEALLIVDDFGNETFDIQLTAQGLFFLPDGQIPQDVAPVPEPSTFLLLGAGLGGLAYLRRRQKKG